MENGRKGLQTKASPPLTDSGLCACFRIDLGVRIILSVQVESLGGARLLHIESPCAYSQVLTHGLV